VGTARFAAMVAIVVIAGCSMSDETEDAIDEFGDDTAEAIEDGVDAVDEFARDVADAFTTSPELLEALREEEGELDTVYRDSGGLLTVGVGHLVREDDGFKLGQRVPRKVLDDLLRKDIARAEQEVRRLVGDLPLTQNEFDALVDLVFNIGPGNAGPTRSPALNKAIRDQDYDAIADNLVYTKDASGRRARGLVYRSERRKRIFRERRYDNPRLG
ncbi:MAG: lysozyme, partial [Pacificimonas sp.]